MSVPDWDLINFFCVQSTVEQSKSLVWVLISFSHKFFTRNQPPSSFIVLGNLRNSLNFILRIRHDKSTWLIVFPFNSLNKQLSFCFVSLSPPTQSICKCFHPINKLWSKNANKNDVFIDLKKAAMERDARFYFHLLFMFCCYFCDVFMLYTL